MQQFYDVSPAIMPSVFLSAGAVVFSTPRASEICPICCCVYAVPSVTHRGGGGH